MIHPLQAARVGRHADGGQDGCARRRAGRALRAGALAAVTVVLAGCSAVGFLYGQADWLVTQYVADRADLDDTQEARLSARLAQTHAWHRREELPHYVELLGRAGELVARGADEPSVLALVHDLDERRRVLMAALATAVAPTLVSLGADQHDALAASFEARHEERLETWANPDAAERLARRQARARERTEDWTGPLDAAQAERLAAAVARLPDRAVAWSTYQRSMEQRLVEMLRAGAGEAAVRAFLDGWLGGASQPQAMRRSAAAWRAGMARLLVAVERLLTDEQRARVVEELHGYRAAARAAQES